MKMYVNVTSASVLTRTKFFRKERDANLDKHLIAVSALGDHYEPDLQNLEFYGGFSVVRVKLHVICTHDAAWSNCAIHQQVRLYESEHTVAVKELRPRGFGPRELEKYTNAFKKDPRHDFLDRDSESYTDSYLTRNDLEGTHRYVRDPPPGNE